MTKKEQQNIDKVTKNLQEQVEKGIKTPEEAKLIFEMSYLVIVKPPSLLDYI